MVAVAHRIDKRMLLAGLCAECGQRRENTGLLLRRHQPAPDRAAALHQLCVIELLHPVRLCLQRLNDGFLHVVQQNHDMRQLQRSASADADTGRDALRHGGFRRTHRRNRALVVVVLLQVDLADQTGAHFAVALNALDIDHGILIFRKHTVFQIILHGLLNLCDALCNVIILQIDLRQDQAKRRGLLPDKAFGFCPVCGFTGVLVTCADGPCLGHAVLFRQQDVCCAECGALIHKSYPFCLKIRMLRTDGAAENFTPEGENPSKGVYKLNGLCYNSS